MRAPDGNMTTRQALTSTTSKIIAFHYIKTVKNVVYYILDHIRGTVSALGSLHVEDVHDPLDIRSYPIEFIGARYDKTSNYQKMIIIL